MDIVIRKKDLHALAAVLLAAAASVAWYYYDYYKIERDLYAFAESQMTDLFGPGQDRNEWDVLVTVKQAKTFGFFGPTWGAIHTFVRRKGDEEMKTFKGIEYYVKRSGGKWLEIDSAGCGALEHHVDGFVEFEKRGLKVAQSAYDRALKFNRTSTAQAETTEGQS